MAITYNNAKPDEVKSASINLNPQEPINNANAPQLAPECGGLENVSHFLSITTANQYINKWKEYQVHLKNATNVSIISLLIKKIGSYIFGSYQKSINEINRTMLINFERFSLDPNFPHSNSLKQLLSLTSVLEIHIGIKPLSNDTKSCWNDYAKKQDSAFNPEKSAWFGKDQMQCVIFIGKDLQNNIITIEIP